MHLKIISFPFGRLMMFIISILFCHMLNAQQNFQAGYIVSSQGDSIHGYIDYRNWEMNPKAVEFKKDLNSSIVKYFPLDIQSFGVLDEIYQSAIVQTEVSPVHINDLDNKSELIFETDTTFLQTLLRGSYSLFYYKNRIGKDQFYVKKGGGYDLLIYKRYLKEENGVNRLVENKIYIGQLVSYFSDCQSVQSKFKRLDYDKKSIINIFVNYADCINSKITFQKIPEGIITNIGIVGGVSLTNSKFSGPASFNYLTKSEFETSVDFAGGLFFDFVFSRNNRKWSIYNEVNFSTYSLESQYTDYVSSNNYTISDLQMKFSYLKMNNMLRFKYPVGKAFIFANAGISYGFLKTEVNIRNEEKHFSSIITYKYGPVLKDTRSLELGIVAGLGVNYNRFSIEVRYETGSGVSAYTALGNRVTRYHFLLGYTIGSY